MKDKDVNMLTRQKNWNCPLCKKSDKVYGISGTLYEGNYPDARKFDMICERVVIFGMVVQEPTLIGVEELIEKRRN